MNPVLHVTKGDQKWAKKSQQLVGLVRGLGMGTEERETPHPQRHWTHHEA